MKKTISYQCDAEGCDHILNGTAIGIQYSEAGALYKPVPTSWFDKMHDLCCSWACVGYFLSVKVGLDLKPGKEESDVGGE